MAQSAQGRKSITVFLLRAISLFHQQTNEWKNKLQVTKGKKVMKDCIPYEGPHTKEAWGRKSSRGKMLGTDLNPHFISFWATWHGGRNRNGDVHFKCRCFCPWWRSGTRSSLRSPPALTTLWFHQDHSMLLKRSHRFIPGIFTVLQVSGTKQPNTEQLSLSKEAQLARTGDASVTYSYLTRGATKPPSLCLLPSHPVGIIATHQWW